MSACECALSVTDVDTVCLTSSVQLCHGLVNLVCVRACVCVESVAMEAFIFPCLLQDCFFFQTYMKELQMDKIPNECFVLSCVHLDTHTHTHTGGTRAHTRLEVFVIVIQNDDICMRNHLAAPPL